MNFHDKEPANFDHIDIYANDGKCPICESSIKINSFRNQLYCQNNCYKLNKYYDYKTIDLFDCKFTIINRWENVEMDELEIAKQISYWKEDDRYLAKILEN